MKRKSLGLVAVLLVGCMFLTQNVFAGSLPPVTAKRTALLICYHILRSGGLDMVISPDVFSTNDALPDELLRMVGIGSNGAPNSTIRAAAKLNTQDPTKIFEYLDDNMPSKFRAAWDRGIQATRDALSDVDISSLIAGTAADADDLREELFNSAIVCPEIGSGTGEEYASIFSYFYVDMAESAIAFRDTTNALDYFGVSSQEEFDSDAMASLIYLAQVDYMINDGGKSYLLNALGSQGFTTLGDRFWSYWQTKCPDLNQEVAAEQFIYDWMRAGTRLLDDVSELYGREFSLMDTGDAGEVTGYAQRAFDILSLRNMDSATRDLDKVNITFDEALDLAEKMVGYIKPIQSLTGLSLNDDSQKSLIMDIAILASDFDMMQKDGIDGSIVLEYLENGTVAGVDLGSTVEGLIGKPLDDAIGTYTGWLRTAYNFLNSEYGATENMAAAAEKTQDLINLATTNDNFLALMGFYIHPAQSISADSAINADLSGTVKSYVDLVNNFTDRDINTYSSTVDMNKGWMAGIVSYWGDFYLTSKNTALSQGKSEADAEAIAWNMLTEQIAARLVVKEGFQYAVLKSESRPFILQEDYSRSLTNQFERHLDPNNLASSAANLRSIASNLVWDAGDDSFSNLKPILNSLPQKEYDLMEEVFGASEQTTEYGIAPIPGPGFAVGDSNMFM